MGSFQGKIVLVTGGNSGIGQAIAQAFAKEGATVVITGRRQPEGEAAASSLREAGGKAEFSQADLTDEAQVIRLLETIASRHGRLDIACNNAGVLLSRSLLDEFREEDYTKTIDGNLKSTFLSMKHELKQMLRQGDGNIVNVASVIGGRIGRPTMSAYAAAKAGVLALTQVAALEYIAKGIRINAVSPGSTRTSMSLLPGESLAARETRAAATFPIGRIAEPSEIAKAVLWLSSANASFVVGQDIVLDGGLSIQ